MQRNQHKSWITCSAAMNKRSNFPSTLSGRPNKLDSEGNFLGELLLSGIKNLNFRDAIFQEQWLAVSICTNERYSENVESLTWKYFNPALLQVHIIFTSVLVELRRHLIRCKYFPL